MSVLLGLLTDNQRNLVEGLPLKRLFRSLCANAVIYKNL